jgi:hypothetical protein
MGTARTLCLGELGNVQLALQLLLPLRDDLVDV